jgi:hypothetical protein
MAPFPEQRLVALLRVLTPAPAGLVAAVRQIPRVHCELDNRGAAATATGPRTEEPGAPVHPAGPKPVEAG